MNYDLIGTNDYKVFLLETVLVNRGVKDIDAYLNVSEEDTYHYSLLDNIDEAVELLLEHLDKGSKIMNIKDSDFDGACSSAIVHNYIKRIKPNADLEFHVHHTKIHGVYNDDIGDDIDLVIVPDAGTNDFKEIEKLYERGIDVIILDHHKPSTNQYKYDNNKAIVVNNQLSKNYPNKELCGAGIVYKFCKAIDDKLGVNHADDYLDLVAAANVADLMSMKSLETRYYILEGLKKENIRNPFIKAIAERLDFVIKGEINTKTIGWNIAPIINGTIRYGTQEEKEDMFRAMLETCDKTIPYKPRGSDEEMEQPIAEAMARICANAKGRQDRARRKSAEELGFIIEEQGLADENILVVNATDKLDKSLTGLVAMELAQKHKRPTLVLHERVNVDDNGEKTKVYHGSGRNFNNSPIEDLRGTLDELGVFNYVQGHPSAYGIEVDKDELDFAIDETKKAFDGFDFNENYIVDFVIPENDIHPNIIFELSEDKTIWGHEVEEPLLVVKEMVIDSSQFALIGKHKNTIKFEHNGVEFIKFRSSEEEYSSIIKDKDFINISVVGRCDINEWNGNKSAQIIIEDWEFKDTKDIDEILALF